MKRLALLVVLLLAACAPSEQAIQTAIAGTQAGWTPVPTQTPWKIVQTEIVVQTKLITATLPPTPQNTPEPTVSALLDLKSPGFYLVGVDISPGVWRSLGTGDECYWEVSTASGDIMENDFGLAGGTAYVAASAFQVEFGSGCGSWTFIQAP